MSSVSSSVSATIAEVITISYNDLIRTDDDSNTKNSVSNQIELAFGADPSCLGLLAVTDVPNFVEVRQKLLPMARQLAQLSPKELDNLTIKEAQYQVGWSHGKERLEGSSKFDLSKGSFYANPLVDDLAEAMKQRNQQEDGERNFEKEDKEELDRVAMNNPGFFAPNVWPTHVMPELETEIKAMGKLIWDVGMLIAQSSDCYVSSKCPGYSPKKLESVLRRSLCCKARLLHYFSQTDVNDNAQSSEASKQNKSLDDSDFSDWCGWHNDHGSLTGLVPAMYFNEHGQIILPNDPNCGLHIKARNGKIVKVSLPSNALAFQIGETAQIHTGGHLQATPHAVRGSRQNGITRESFAVFIEPEYHDDMDIPLGLTVDDAQQHDIILPKSVRTLRSRWKEGMNFGEFSQATFSAFH